MFLFVTWDFKRWVVGFKVEQYIQPEHVILL